MKVNAYLENCRTCICDAIGKSERGGPAWQSLVQALTELDAFLHGEFQHLTRIDTDIPKNKNYPPDAVQCDYCGGHGCTACDDKGWLPAGHPKGRLCLREACGKPIPPNQVAVYCCNQCAYDDA